MANDIIDINVYETVETVDIIVQPNLTTVNITQINAGNGNVPVGGTVGQVLAKIDSANFNTQWVNQSGGGGGGATNLGYSPSATNGIVTSDTGTDATIPLADGTNAGLLTPAEKTSIATIPNVNTNAIDRDTVKLGEAVTKGQAVYVSNADGTNIIVLKASNASEATSSKIFGLIETTGALNAIVNVVTAGLFSGLNTSTATVGDAVWLGTAGNLLFGLANKPVAPAHLVYIGIVTRVSATVGEIFVAIQNGFELSEIHDVLLTSLANNEGLFYDSATSLWKNKTVVTALGFTPYNATNPSGYQTASQVQTIADAKVTQTITNGVTATAPSEDVVFDALALKQNVLTDVNFGSFLNSLTAKNALIDADEVTSDDSADSSKAKKTSWGNVWATFLKPKTDYFYQPLRAILTNTTASFTTADETKLDGIATGATANSSDAILLARANHTGTQPSSTISDFNSATRAQVEAELVAGSNITITPSGTGEARQLTIASTGSASTQEAYTVLANNTNATATPTEQVFKSVAEQTYSGTITQTAGAAATGATAHTYQWTQIGKLVTLQLNIDFATAGTTVTAINCELPSDLPTPRIPSSVTAVNQVICYSFGTMSAANQLSVATAGTASLRTKSISPNVFEISIQRGSGSYANAYATITYLAQ